MHVHVELPTDAVSITKTESGGTGGDGSSTEHTGEAAEQQEDGKFRHAVENEKNVSLILIKSTPCID